jgi:integrase
VRDQVAIRLDGGERAEARHPGVPKVTAHGMRGLHGTLAVDSGITSHAVASALGHESFRTTAESYAKRESVAGAQQKRALAVLIGGRLAS